MIIFKLVSQRKLTPFRLTLWGVGGRGADCILFGKNWCRI